MSVLLGAHISTQGGVERAPERARAVGANSMQIFTKTPSQWRDPEVDPRRALRFRAAVAQHRLAQVVSHDSYLINLASPDPALRLRSERSFVAELRRALALEIPWVVSHPGNYMDDRAAGVARNAESYARCMAEVPPPGPSVAIETTAGSGTALGASFEEIAALLDRMPAWAQRRVGVCADTCHLLAAGHDLVNDFDGVWERFDRIIGLDRLVVLHLNDSREPLGSRVDRHALIGDGHLGTEPFRRLMTDPRFARVIKIIETPKGADLVTNDRRTLRQLRDWHRAPRAGLAVPERASDPQPVRG